MLWFLIWSCYICADPLVRPSLRSKDHSDFISEQYLLKNTSPQDYGLAFQKNLPCKKCRIVTAGQAPVLTLIASNSQELDLLRQWVKLVDQASEAVTITLYCVVVQEHQVENFLSSLLYPSVGSILAWKEGLTNLLLDMEREHGVTLLASPRLTIQTGSKASLKMMDDFRIGGISNQSRNQQLDLALTIECHKQGENSYRLDVDFAQKISLKTQQHISAPNQTNQLKTRVSLKKKELIFLGSAGQWSWVSDAAALSFLKILPEALIPYFHQDQGSKSQLIILAECH